jgi:hypothetical protein
MNNTQEYHNLFSFNYLKHHLNQTIEYYNGRNISFSSKKDIKITINELKSLGDNITDIYTGFLTNYCLLHEITNKLKECECYDYIDFRKQFKSRDYFKVNVSDGSSWIIRQGRKTESYIHIHPSRVGINTVRFTANTWKTAIMCYLYKLNSQDFSFDIGTINLLRTNYLELSPIKKLKDNSKIQEAYNLIVNRADSITTQ